MGNVFSSVQPAEEFVLNPVGTGSRSAPRPGTWFEGVFRDHYPRVVAMLARLTGDRGQSEEIAADVFCKLAQRPHLEGRDDLAAWVYRVAMNAGFDALRANSRRRRREQEATTESLRISSQPGALDDLLQAERCGRVRAVLESLKPRDAQLLLLRASGLAYRELAQTLGIQAGSVGTLLARAEQEFERKYRFRYGDDL
jgi:RNA polymerase sigma-70 factor (ECF subfamily)